MFTNIWVKNIPMTNEEKRLLMEAKVKINALVDELQVLNNKVSAIEKTIIRMHEAGTSL